eukprot:m.340016 g.340016  ORF g.340016 m.340016 type:complete len:676 (-) comp20589_c1_seq3:342-2369(-)
MFRNRNMVSLRRSAMAFVLLGSIADARLQKRSYFDAMNQNSFDESFFNNRTRRSECSSPPLRANVNFPESLVGTCHINYDMHSGYIPVTPTDFLFYWHFGPKEAPIADAPVIFWTNGGPGCSSMEGAISELGPLSLFQGKESSPLYTGRLSDNPYSWNAYAHLVTVDQPRYVGFSTGTGRNRIHSSIDAAKDIVVFIRSWFEQYPEINRNTKVYIAGESYGGHYVPAWAEEIMAHNDALPSDDSERINFAGIALGNACVDNRMQIDSAKYIEFLRTAKLVGADDEIPSAYSSGNVVRQHLGYSPNFYDYRIKSIKSCAACYDYDYTDWGNWLLRSDVQTALNVCPNSGDNAFGAHGGCISMGGFDMGQPNDYGKEALAKALDRHVPVVFYYGKTDMACDYVGGHAMAESLNWQGKSGFQSAELHELLIAAAPAAQIQQFGTLTWIQVDSAGHMVPTDQPAAAFFAINHLLGNFSVEDVLLPASGGAATTSSHTCPPPPVCPDCAIPPPPPPPECPECATCAAPASEEVPVSSAGTVSGTACAPCLSTSDDVLATTSDDGLVCPPPVPCPECPTPTAAPTRASADMSMPVRCPQYPFQAPNDLGAVSTDSASARKEVVVGLATMVVVLAVALAVVLVRARSSQHAYVSAARENPDMYATLNTVGFDIGDDEDDEAF